MPQKGPYRAIQCTSLSKTFEEAIDKLEIRMLEQKPLGPGQMRIKVFAASLNFFDLLMLVGKYQVKPNIPFTVLNEGSGEVIEIAPDVQRFKVGDNVVFGMNEGALSEELVLSEHVCARKPPTIDHVHASGLYVGFTTAYHGLVQRAHLKKGEVLLVTGAGGGMGTAAIQIGKLLGATVIAVASTPEKLQVAKQVGADYVINYSSEDLKEMVAKYTDGKWADVVYECVGGELFHKCVRCIAGEGRLLVVGFASGKIPEFPINLALVKGFSVIGVRAGMEMMLHPELAQEMYNKIEEWGTAGKLIPFVDRVFDLNNYKEAFRVIADRKALGKVVIRLAVAHAKL